MKKTILKIAIGLLILAGAVGAEASILGPGDVMGPLTPSVWMFSESTTISPEDFENMNISIGTSTGSTKLSVDGTTTAEFLVPRYTQTYDLGSATKEWNNLYAKDVRVSGTLYAAGLIMTGDILMDDNNIKYATYVSAGTLHATSTDTSSYFLHNIGVGTTTPETLLSVWSDGTKSTGLFQIATGTTPVLYVDSSGNIGIGTTTPTARLEVATSTDGIASFAVSNATTGDVFIIDEGGNVGIGTTAPDSKLHIISGGVGQDIITIDASDSGNIFVVRENASGDGLMRIRDKNAAVKILFNTADVSYITGGNLGLGTTTPRVILDAWGSARFGTSTDSVLYVEAGDGDINVGGTLKTGNIIFPEDGGAMTAIDMSVTAAPATSTEHSYAFNIDGRTILKVRAEAKGENGGGGIKDELVWIGDSTTSTTDERIAGLRLDVNGSALFGTTSDDAVGVLYVDSYTERVGIATSTPDEELSVQGDVFVSGTITAVGGINGSFKHMTFAATTSPQAIGTVNTWQDVTFDKIIDEHDSGDWGITQYINDATSTIPRTGSYMVIFETHWELTTGTKKLVEMTLLKNNVEINGTLEQSNIGVGDGIVGLHGFMHDEFTIGDELRLQIASDTTNARLSATSTNSTQIPAIAKIIISENNIIE